MSEKAIWVLAEVRESSLTRACLQLLGGARELAGQRGLATAAVLLGGQQAHADELAQRADLVLWLQDARLLLYEATRALHAVWRLVEAQGMPAAILAPASAAGLELMPRLAARCRTGYLGGCVDLWWEGAELAGRRPVYGGRVYEEAVFVGKPGLATVRPGVFGTAARLSAPGRVQVVPLELPDSLGPQLSDRQRTTAARQDVSEANRVVAGGRGMGSRESFALLDELADVLGGAVGASRAVVDAGLRPLDEQVGKSGKTISPELYVACGISGAIHHVLGMSGSKVVVAINSDPEALIFKNADFGLVGDALRIIPALTAALKTAQDAPRQEP